ncbi:DDRGK domain-containing protein 1-like isoform X3 [Scyliorhinus torazame]|uniref:DDRGK domain-containing protein 1-like isoform X3 n=1 Tax=Scyliorhinus torazame TaxID=75743 RepID=UPI003B5A95DD
MDPVLYVLAAAILVILIFFASRIRGRAQKADQNQQRNVVAAAGRPRPVNEDRPVGAPRMRRNLRNRVLARRLLEAEQEAQFEEEEAGNDHEEVQVLGKIGAKKQRKLEEKEQRKAQREAEEEEREERRKLQLKRDEDRKKDEERLRLEEKRKEEELKKAWEEKQRRDHEEYLKLKEAFTVEEEGIEVEPDENEAQDLLQDFINYIKSTKVVLLEDLASHSGLRTQLLGQLIKSNQLHCCGMLLTDFKI